MYLATYVVIPLALIVALYILSYLKEYIRYRKLAIRLPGPEPHILLGNLNDFLLGDAALFKKLRYWGREHFPVYRLSAGLYTSANISSAEDFETVASSMKNIQKGPIYGLLEMWLGEGLLTSYGAKWQSRRKILTPAFHFSILQQFIQIFNNETENLVKILKRECHKPEINVIPYISAFTLCSINETSMGVKLDLNNEDDKNYYLSTHQVGKLIYQRILRPWLHLHFPYYYLSPSGYKERNLIKSLHNYTNEVIKKRAENFEKFKVAEDDDDTFTYSKRKNMAMLDLLLNASGSAIDDRGIEDEVNTFLFEGHDTTAMSICFTLMLLASHRDVQELILQEINTVLGDSNSQPTYKDLQELKYMERCIKESLRIYPSVPFIARVLDEDIVSSNGYTLPKGLITNLHIFDIHRDPKIWPNPEKFDPDRFLPENCQDRHPFAYVPFSGGPRNCIGQKYAIMELKASLCGIIRNFILEPVDTPDNIVLVPDIVLRPEKDIVRVKFVPRL